MDYYSILDNGPSQAAPETAPPNLVHSKAPATLVSPKMSKEKEAAPVVREGLRFPGEDGGKSLGEMASRDLDATLLLLAERAQYITGASGAAIALREGDSMVCCASSGPSAPELGAHLQIDSGLSAESVKTRQILHCDDAENDPRVNRESCRAFGIASVVVMPLVRGDEVYGVFELLSGRPRAFEERDFVALNRLADMIQTAVEHADAAKRAETELGLPPAPGIITAKSTPPVVKDKSPGDLAVADSSRTAPVVEKALAAAASAGTSDLHAATLSVPSPARIETPAPELIADDAPAAIELTNSATVIAFGNLRRCETCGFPVSEGRRLCLDCEAANPGAIASVNGDPEFFDPAAEQNLSWMRSHLYLIATAVVALATIVLLAWRL